jgi:putative sugar O-methyltransferase
VRQIKRHGLADFRGATSTIGTSFADNPYTDIRGELDTTRGRPLKFLLERVFPFSRIMDAQVAMTRSHARDSNALMAARMVESAEAQQLLAKYEMPNSLLGGCSVAARFGDGALSLHYLRLLQLIDRVRRFAPLDDARSVFEIGGGFGANVHLLIELFPLLRKIVYLDVPPNLYVGTCYLRTLYGAAVRDFSETKSLATISFRDDDSLEILAICPWQIEALDLHVDLFWNANSFVEMPWSVVSNYATRVLGLPGASGTNIVLVTYGGAESNTIAAEELPHAFSGREFVGEEFWMLGWPNETCVDPERDAIWKSFLFVSRGVPASEAALTARIG